MTLADKIIKSARTWINTPFRHQGRIKGVGVDCVNFVSEVARESGIEIEIPHNYRPHEDGTIMLKLLTEHMHIVEEAKPGDVLALCDEALRERGIPRHLVFVTEVTPKTTFIIHASERGVREHRTDASWIRRIHSIWRIKDAA